ncbi:MAG: hypothetical protein M1839_004251 [Geoglossum umbratile]|nr:MAG: hypothetical protein M1839_004251 [Geoglossum umbratile]
MRIPQNAHLQSSLLFLLPSLATASLLDCSNVVADQTSFDLSPLKGEHTVAKETGETPPSITNLTVTINICAALKKPKDANKEDSCPSGTRVCGIEHIINPADHSNTISRVIPIAGDFIHESRPLDDHWTRLKSSSSHADSKKEGVRGVLHGGLYDHRKQKAIIEFLCDKSLEGTEGLERSDGGSVEKRRRVRTTEEEGDGDGDGDDGKWVEGGPSLIIKSYGPLTDGASEDVLRMEWRTKYACEDMKNGDSETNGHWGFFTWLIIMTFDSVFLGTATYLIFGSWLNYNRYGARGWDLLPHGDTIRDMPYLMRDWSRRVVSTVQGGGSRGGYSAV